MPYPWVWNQHPLHFKWTNTLLQLGFGLGTSRFEWKSKSYLDHSYHVWSRTLHSHLPKTYLYVEQSSEFGRGNPGIDIKTVGPRGATKRMYPDVLSYDKIIELTGSSRFLWLSPSKDGRMRMGVESIQVGWPRCCDGQFLHTASPSSLEGDLNKFWEIFTNGEMQKMLWFTKVERTKEAHQRMPLSLSVRSLAAAVLKRRRKCWPTF